MAVTITASPNKYTPSDNPIIWQWSSTATSGANFSFIVEVYVDTVLIGSHQIFREQYSLGNGYGHIDVSEIIKPLIPHAIIGSSTVVVDASNYRAVYVKIREFYGTTPTFHADATSSIIYPFKACVNPIDFDSWDYTDFKISGTSKRFLTDSPNTLEIREGQDYYVNIITDAVVDQGLFLDFYDANNVLITQYDYTNIAYSGYRITQCNLNSNNYVGTLTQPVLDTVAYVNIYFADSNPTALSEVKKITFDRGCANGAELIWMNKYGAFDVFNYGHNMIASSDITGKTFEKQYGNWIGTTYTLDSTNSGVHSYFKTANDKVKLVSKYIDSTTQNWLVDSAYISSLVYMMDVVRQKVNIASSSYEESNDEFIEETTESVDLTLPNIRKSSLL